MWVRCGLVSSGAWQSVQRRGRAGDLMAWSGVPVSPSTSLVSPTSPRPLCLWTCAVSGAAVVSSGRGSETRRGAVSCLGPRGENLDRPRAAGVRGVGGPGVRASQASPVFSIFHKPHDVRFCNSFPAFGEKETSAASWLHPPVILVPLNSGWGGRALREADPPSSSPSPGLLVQESSS